MYKTPWIGVSCLKALEVSCNLPSTKFFGKLQLTSQGLRQLTLSVIVHFLHRRKTLTEITRITYMQPT